MYVVHVVPEKYLTKYKGKQCVHTKTFTHSNKQTYLLKDENYTHRQRLKIIYRGSFKSFVALYADRISSDQHFVENCIEKISIRLEVTVISYLSIPFFPRRVASLELSMI